jgi:hypothetical protein
MRTDLLSREYSKWTTWVIVASSFQTKSLINLERTPATCLDMYTEFLRYSVFGCELGSDLPSDVCIHMHDINYGLPSVDFNCMWTKQKWKQVMENKSAVKLNYFNTLLTH